MTKFTRKLQLAQKTRQKSTLQTVEHQGEIKNVINCKYLFKVTKNDTRLIAMDVALVSFIIDFAPVLTHWVSIVLIADY